CAMRCEKGDCACADDDQYPAGASDVLGREVEEPVGYLLDGAADAVVRALASVGEGDLSFGGHQAGGGQLADRRFDRRGVELPGARYPGDELAAVDAAAAACGDGEDQPLVERDVAAGQQRLQQGAEGALGLADDLCVKRRVVGHRLLLWGGSVDHPLARPTLAAPTLSFVGSTNKWLDLPA